MPVELKHVTCTYSPGTSQEIRAVTDLSLKIQDGEFVAVMGRTGSGKSTLIQLVAGLLEPDSGQVLLDLSLIHIWSIRALSADWRARRGSFWKWRKFFTFPDSEGLR